MVSRPLDTGARIPEITGVRRRREGTKGRKLNDINREKSRFIPANNFPKPDDDYGEREGGVPRCTYLVKESGAARRLRHVLTYGFSGLCLSGLVAAGVFVRGW